MTISSLYEALDRRQPNIFYNKLVRVAYQLTPDEVMKLKKRAEKIFGSSGIDLIVEALGERRETAGE